MVAVKSNANAARWRARGLYDFSLPERVPFLRGIGELGVTG